MVLMRAAQSHWGRKCQALGRSALGLQGPAQQPEVPGNVLATVLPPPVPLSRLPHAFRQKDRPCYRSVDLRTQQAPLCAKLLLWDGRKCGQSEASVGGALRGPRSDPAATLQRPQARHSDHPLGRHTEPCPSPFPQRPSFPAPLWTGKHTP